MKPKQRKIVRSLFQDFRQLLKYVSFLRRRQLGFLWILLIVSAFSEVISLGLVLPFLGAMSNAESLIKHSELKSFINFFGIETASQLVTVLTLVFITAVIIANGLRILTINLQVNLAAKISGDLSCQIYKQMLSQPYEFHLQKNSSDLINLVTGDTRDLTYKILVPLLESITNSVLVISLLVGVLVINWQVTLVVSAFLVSVYFGLYWLKSKRLKHDSQILVQSSEQQIKIVQESLGGIRDVLLGGTQTFFQSIYRQSDEPYRRSIASILIFAQTPRYFVEGMAMALVATFAFVLGQDGNFENVLPVMGVFILASNRLLPAMQRSFSAWVKIQGARASLDRLLSSLQQPIDPFQLWVPSKEEVLCLNEELRFKHVWFRYLDESNWVLQDFNLAIKANTTVGFVGSTGSGKSTTADLILGLLKPQRGLISVDGQVLDGEKSRQWQYGIGHVPQSIFLADITIAENIAFGIPKHQIDFEQVRKAAQLAKIDSFIQGLPAKYETFVGERGVRLSGGQRQRIGIARALYRQPSLIVFDEATSALDNATEKDVMEAINSLKHHFTIILIAHRLTTVKGCDCIFELENGMISCSGTYEELIESSQSFRDAVINIS